jgi:hypothetical protein
MVGSRVEAMVRIRDDGVDDGGMWRVVGMGWGWLGAERVSRIESCSGERKVVSKVGSDGGGGCSGVAVVVEVETGMEGTSFVPLSLLLSLGGFRRSSHVFRSSCNLCFRY